MNENTGYAYLFLDSLEGMARTVLSVVPRVLAALVILALGWLIARLISRGVARLLQAAGLDRLADRLGATQLLQRANVRLRPSTLLGRLIYYVLLLVVIITAADTVGWTAVSTEISKLLGYLPRLLSALVFFVVGSYIASFIRDLVRGAAGSLGISAGRIISSVTYYLLMLIITLTALEQGGVDTSIITSNLLVIVGSVTLAGAIAYGLASRDVLTNILAGFFTRRAVRVGQLIEVDGQRGRVISMSGLSITLQVSPTERLILPSQLLITHPIRIIDEESL
ncbi:mechanosensitive ion channel family protein [Neolewinella sp.]|uniref:mechanosensitive ion channel family protein n=1 Tax=Neolewinella sp. TaxID=2993543 RepID=UPI003B526531